MLATFCAASGESMPESSGPDSFNALPLLTGQRTLKAVRDKLVLQNNGAKQLALRQGAWKFIPRNPGKEGPGEEKPRGELYDLAVDLAESKNIAKDNPEKLAELTALLASICERPRSRP